MEVNNNLYPVIDQDYYNTGFYLPNSGILGENTIKALTHLTNYAEKVKNQKSTWTQLGEAVGEISRTVEPVLTAMSQPRQQVDNSVNVNIGNSTTVINNNAQQRETEEERTNRALRIAGVVGIFGAILGVIGLAKADNSIKAINKNSRFLTEVTDESFNEICADDTTKRAFSSVVRDAAVISGRQLKDANHSKIKAISLIATSALMAIGALFGSMLAVQIGAVGLGVLGAVYLYQALTNDTLEENKETANKMLETIATLQNNQENAQARDVALAAFRSWTPQNFEPSAPPMEPEFVPYNPHHNLHPVNN